MIPCILPDPTPLIVGTLCFFLAGVVSGIWIGFKLWRVTYVAPHEILMGGRDPKVHRLFGRRRRPF